MVQYEFFILSQTYPTFALETDGGSKAGKVLKTKYQLCDTFFTRYLIKKGCNKESP